MKWTTVFFLALVLVLGPDSPVAQVPSSEKLSPGIEGLVDLTLESRVYGNSRTIRVLLPPGYESPSNAERRYPVFYFTDGIFAFADGGWGLPGVAGDLMKEGRIPHWIFVGMDNGGSTLEPPSANPVADRAGEYLPWPDGSWDEEPVPEPRGDRFPAFLTEEIMPLIEEKFRTSPGPGSTGLAGDSYAGLAALYFVVKKPGVVGHLYLQSPSLHVSEGKILSLAAALEVWPERIFLAAGTKEGPTAEAQEAMVSHVQGLAELVRAKNPTAAVEVSLAEGAGHDFDNFRQQLPGAVEFLLGKSLSP